MLQLEPLEQQAGVRSLSFFPPPLPSPCTKKPQCGTGFHTEPHCKLLLEPPPDLKKACFSLTQGGCCTLSGYKTHIRTSSLLICSLCQSHKTCEFAVTGMK